MRLIKFLAVNLFFYALLKAPGLLAGKPVPSSVITMYMFFIVMTVLLVMTITDEGANGLFAPIRSLLEDPSRALARKVLFVLLPVAAALSVQYLSTDPGPPFELRSAHPAPPGVVRAYGKVYELDGLENPLRALEKENPAAFKELAREGGEVYFRNCFFCHGARLDGRGHYAYAMDPLPMPFTGSDTIAQLKESYLFWRIVKGGPGLPREGGPNISSMPAWENELTEEEVWKVILFLYDYTGNRPRSWKD